MKSSKSDSFLLISVQLIVHAWCRLHMICVYWLCLFTAKKRTQEVPRSIEQISSLTGGGGTCCVCCREEIEPRPRGVSVCTFRSFVVVADRTQYIARSDFVVGSLVYWRPCSRIAQPSHAAKLMLPLDTPLIRARRGACLPIVPTSDNGLHGPTYSQSNEIVVHTNASVHSTDNM